MTPTIDEILAKMNNAKYFSKLDLNQAFHQITLAEESRYITTFSTHIGLRRYKKLNYGVSAAPEIFQNEIRQALNGLQNVMNIADDIILYAEDEENHDKFLEALFREKSDSKQKEMYVQSEQD
jgi:hypothetical protein